MREPGTWDKREVVTPTSFIYYLKQKAETWGTIGDIDCKMKKSIPYILLAVVLVVILIAVRPLKNNHRSEDDKGKEESHLYLPSDDSIRTSSKNSTICIYMENSGSMDGYVNVNSEFKDALGKVIVKSYNFSKSTNLFFVNDDIYDVQGTALKGDVNTFISQLNAKNMKVGATGSSNINKIFKMVIDKTNSDTVSIIFSDFVYSIKGTDVSSQVSNAKNATMGAFMDAIKKDPNFATIILQCSSQFQGKYYDRSDMPIAYSGTRPYYIFILGNYDRLIELDKKLELNNSSTGIPGYLNKFILSSKFWKLNENTVQILTNSYTNSDLIKPARNDYDVDFFKFSNSEDCWSFAYALGLSNLFVDGSYLIDRNNYVIEPNDVKLIKAEYTKDQAALSEVPQFKTPLVLQFQTDNATKIPNLIVRLENRIPSWVSLSNIPDDKGVVPSPNQTFAIGSLIDGVYEAYQSYLDKKPIFEFEVKINKYK